MQGDFEIQLLEGDSAMSDCKGFVNKLNGKDRGRTVERSCFLDTSILSIKHP